MLTISHAIYQVGEGQLLLRVRPLSSKFSDPPCVHAGDSTASLQPVPFPLQCPGKEEHLSQDFFWYHTSRARSKTFVNLREVPDRFKLPPSPGNTS